jgi:peptidoglycan hydrolase-like protein with peptidoglycan-binding domain
MYSVSGSPVVLLYGSVPAYRDLYEGLTGPDVTELNRDLVKLGYTTAAALGPRSGWDYYSAATAYAVEQLQTHFGLAVTGELTLGEAVVQPGPVLVTALGSTTALGAPASAGTVVADGTSVTPQVVIPLDAGAEGQVKVGDKVAVTLPDGSITAGKVTQVAKIATSSSSSSPGSSSPGSSADSSSNSSGAATVDVYVSLTHPGAARHLSQAPVTVTITQSSVRNVLVVPVDALLAQPGGGYAVEVITGHGHRLVKVTPGLFDDAAGLVQVSGTLAAGQRVVVPGI